MTDPYNGQTSIVHTTSFCRSLASLALTSLALSFGSVGFIGNNSIEIALLSSFRIYWAM